MPLDAMSPLTTFSDDEDSMDVDASRFEEQHTPSSPVDSDMGDSTVTTRVNRNVFSPDNVRDSLVYILDPFLMPKLSSLRPGAI